MKHDVTEPLLAGLKDVAEKAGDVLHGAAEAAQPVLEEIGRTANGAVAAWSEDNGIPVDQLAPDLPQNVLGRALGHTAAAAQSAWEMATGFGMMGAGGAEAVVTSPAAATGVGVVIPGAGVATVVAGAAVTVHGAAVGVNTIRNIINDPLLSQSSRPGGGAVSTGGVLPE